MDVREEYEFIKDLWKYIKTHRKFNDKAWNDGDALLIKHRKVTYAPEMMKAYLDHIEIDKEGK